MALRPTSTCCPTCCRPSAIVALFEPRRLRDRAQELLDEEAALGETLEKTWGATLDPETTPRLSLPFDRLLAHTKAQTVPVLNAPDGPDTPSLAATAFDPVVGDTDALGRQSHSVAGRRIPRVRRGRGQRLGRPDRAAARRRGRGRRSRATRSTTRAPPCAHPACTSWSRPLDRGVLLPGVQLAIVAEADLTGRRRVHRRPRGARRGADYYEGLSKGDYVVHRVHGIGRYSRHGDQGDVRRDARPSRRGVQGRRPRLRRLRGHRADPEVHRRRDPEALQDGRRRLGEDAHERAPGGARHRGRVGGALPAPARDTGPCVRSRRAVPDPDRGVVPLRGDAGSGAGDHRDQGRHGAADPDGPPRVRRRGLRQDRGRAARRGQGRVRRQAGRDPRAHHAAREPARSDFPRALRELSGARRGALAVSLREGADRGRERRQGRHGRHRDRHAPVALRRHALQGPRASRGRRRATLRRAAQGADQGDAHECRHPHAHRDADPAHAGDVAHGHS